ncbi:hypothetical protein LSH36_1576g00006 [Paralvinella palmiformis]|uniref:Uncharacterized protein n=1 Tax=Paralvinella palmiformis TaxID=53620 RepID=A0AAD9IT61_9ANNE|nr:hypothetical protein LSH36_1576g00006 [Paralvinella palmiformis]
MFAGSRSEADKAGFESSVRRFEAERMLRVLNSAEPRRGCATGARGLLNVFMSFVILATMYSGTLMVAEVACYLVEIACFTMIAKSSAGSRIFKSCENSEQDDYEAENDLDAEKPLGWDINDLILFVEQDDTPRIPRKLFEEVCQVPVTGSPGPVDRSLLEATGKFFIIILFLVFVFFVVMSFGDAYNISTTNQILATLAGGFIPFTNLLKPAAPQIETGLVRSKSVSNNELSDSDDHTKCDQREEATSNLLDNAMPLQPCTPEIVSGSRQMPNTGPSKTGRAQGKKKKKTD